ncbi:THO complex subunit 3 [Orobanche hederae]
MIKTYFSRFTNGKRNRRMKKVELQTEIIKIPGQFFQNSWGVGAATLPPHPYTVFVPGWNDNYAACLTHRSFAFPYISIVLFGRELTSIPSILVTRDSFMVGFFFRLSGGKCSQQVELSGENINITYKPDGTHIAVGNRDDELTIMDVRKFKPIHKRKFNYEVNEIAWNMTGDKFFLTTGNGTVEVLAYPSLQAVGTLMAHTAGCYCIAIDPLGRYFAVGSADSLVSLWDIKEMLCVRTFTKLEWPVRTLSFNHTGEYIASASEDLFIDISNVETGRSVHQIPCRAAMNSVEWNPKYNMLAYAGDDKNKYQADEDITRIVKLFEEFQNSRGDGQNEI